MIDNRIYTFLQLCQSMNYRKTAEILNMTQPAVTQHIHFLERNYGCKLFIYNGKVLSKTPECEKLEKHALSIIYNENNFKKSILNQEKTRISIGATKTIGDYLIEEKIMNLLKEDKIEVEVIIDNTEHLFQMLNSLELDVLLVEGHFNKAEYDYQLIKKEKLVGICAKEHKFAGKSVAVQELFAEHIILREYGSGTRAVFESFLKQSNYTFKSFEKKTTLSSFKLIERSVRENLGISFVYETIAKSGDLATFSINKSEIYHEFNYVYLKNAKIDKILNIIKEK